PYYFVLKADNGQVIATSEMYASKQGAESGIASVKNNADSITVDES
ncbi:MAG: YegP family protein, partial [Vibrio anguillarum]|nr:YegP family protein [Vibrio anguillarum]